MTQRKTQAGRTFLKKKKLDIPSSLVDELRLSQDRALRTTDGVKFTDVKHTTSLICLDRSDRQPLSLLSLMHFIKQRCP